MTRIHAAVKGEAYIGDAWATAVQQRETHELLMVDPYGSDRKSIGPVILIHGSVTCRPVYGTSS